MALLHPDRLFPADPDTRAIARRLYASIHDLPIISPHGHTEAAWFAKNEPFPDPTHLLILPDHYVYRMLYSQGVSLRELGIHQKEPVDSRKIWRIFAEHYYLFRGTPTRIWLDYEFEILFGLKERLSARTADHYFDVIAEKLQQPDFRPRALYERFRIEALSTTDSPLDSLEDHQTIRDSGWKARILPTFRPDPVVDPSFHGFQENIARLAELTGEDTGIWTGYLNALRKSRERFKAVGCTATDHGHPTANTANLSTDDAERLYATILSCKSTAEQQEHFRAQMLTEMARMSIDDGLVMQLHPGSYRNHNEKVFQQFGRDSGADIPVTIDYVHGLKPVLDLFGNEPSFTLILFTLDESTFSRELAPLAGHYPCLRLGPPWWFLDSPEGMLRFRELVTETAGFYNTIGFNDDTRAFLSIPARHDVARRIDCNYLARLVAEHRISEDEAFEVAQDLTVNLVRKAYRL